jgi:hypothetical protein
MYLCTSCTLKTLSIVKENGNIFVTGHDQTISYNEKCQPRQSSPKNSDCPDYHAKKHRREQKS